MIPTLNEWLKEPRTEMLMRERASQMEYLKWFRVNADFGPADSDCKDQLDEQFMAETGKNLPEGWNVKSDGETTTDQP